MRQGIGGPLLVLTLFGLLVWGFAPAEPQKVPQVTTQHQPVAKPVEGIKVVVSLIVKGNDGTVAAEREMTLPFTPWVGLKVDLFTVKNITWATRRSALILDCGTMEMDDSEARKALRIWTGGDKEWKEVLFFKKGK